MNINFHTEETGAEVFTVTIKVIGKDQLIKLIHFILNKNKGTPR